MDKSVIPLKNGIQVVMGVDSGFLRNDGEIGKRKNAQTKYSLLRRGILAIALAWSLTATLSAADKIRVGFSAISLANAPVWIAEEKGFFKKYDIETEADRDRRRRDPVAERSDRR